MPVTAIYAAIVAVLVVVLGARIVPLRRSRRVGLGDGGDKDLRRAVRIHANLVEYAPMALILMAACELNGAPAWLLHGLGVALVAGRLLHALGLSRSSGISFGRTAGTALTWSVLLAGALAAVVLVLAG
jgi:uncharacterized membrane protein YecN with MAPEG domain